MSEEQVVELCQRYRELARQLLSLRLDGPADPWETHPLTAREAQVLQDRRSCLEAAKSVVRRLHIVGDDWGLPVSPLLDVLTALDQAEYHGDGGMLEPGGRGVLYSIEARVAVEAERRLHRASAKAHRVEGNLVGQDESDLAAGASREDGQGSGLPVRVLPFHLPSHPSLAPTPRQADAWDRLQHVYRHYRTALVIHYSCGLIGVADVPPAIGHIVVGHLSGTPPEVFDARASGEVGALVRFHEFAQRQLAGPWVNWHMSGPQFGFEAIARRQRVLGVAETAVPVAARLDLNRVLWDLYGENYVGHPRLPNLIRLNGISDRLLLDKGQAAAAHAAGNSEALLASTLRKVDAIAALFLRAAERQLVTQVSQTVPAAGRSKAPRRRSVVKATAKRHSAPPRRIKDAPPSRPPPLTGKSKIVYDILKALPKGQGLTGKQIVRKMPPGEQFEESTLTRHIIPLLRKYGVRNEPGTGYFIDPRPRRT